MDLEKIQTCVREGRLLESRHARLERQNDNLTFAQVEQALLAGEILECYPDTGRGESCLVLGYSNNTPIHVVCGWSGNAKESVVLITVYIPKPPKFVDPRTRKRE